MAKRKKAGKITAASIAAVVILFVVGIFTGNIPLDGIFPFQETFVTQTSGLESTADVQVHFIDVGQGDSIYIKAYDKNILIDAGEAESNTDVPNYLKEIGVEKLDVVIATHPHSDHIGAMSAVLEAIPADQIIMPRLAEDMVPTTRTYEQLLETILSKNLQVTAAQDIDEAIDLGHGCRLEILGPLQNYDNLNNMSVITKFTANGYSVLLCGDAEKEAEKDLLEADVDLRANIQKLSHHGSSTSNTKNFLDAVNADCYAICVGKDNSYNHPSDSVIKRVNSYGKPVNRTDYHGTFLYELNESGITVLSER